MIRDRTLLQYDGKLIHFLHGGQAGRYIVMTLALLFGMAFGQGIWTPGLEIETDEFTGAYSEAFRPLFPRESGHVFRGNPATISEAFRPGSRAL